MNNWQVGRITFSPANPIKRIADLIRGQAKQGDVEIPLGGASELRATIDLTNRLTAEDVVDITARAIYYGENVNEIVEDLANKLGKFGACEDQYMNGDVCTKPNCRQCWTSEFKSLLKLAVLKDTKMELADRMINSSKRKTS